MGWLDFWRQAVPEEKSSTPTTLLAELIGAKIAQLPLSAGHTIKTALDSEDEEVARLMPRSIMLRLEMRDGRHLLVKMAVLPIPPPWRIASRDIEYNYDVFVASGPDDDLNEIEFDSKEKEIIAQQIINLDSRSREWKENAEQTDRQMEALDFIEKLI